MNIHDAELFQIADGKLTEMWRFDNTYAFAMQLGLVPPPGAKGGDKPADKPAKGKKEEYIVLARQNDCA